VLTSNITFLIFFVKFFNDNICCFINLALCKLCYSLQDFSHIFTAHAQKQLYVNFRSKFWHRQFDSMTPFSLQRTVFRRFEDVFCWFWATVYKTVRPMLSVRCPSCLPVCPVCNVRALWSNSWTDQDQTWHAGRPRPWPHCVRWGSSSLSLKEHSPHPIFGHIRCGQMAAWIKMPLGMELGLSPGDFVLDRDPALPSPKRGQSPLPNFRPISIVAKRLHASRCHLVWR